MRTKRTLLTTLLTVAAGIGYGGWSWAQSPDGYSQPSLRDQSEYPTAENAEGKSPEDLRVRAAVDQYLREKEEARKAEEACKKAQAEAEGYEVGTDLKMSVRWNITNGVTFETPNKDFVSHLGFRFQFDNVWFDQRPDALRRQPAAGGIGELEDGFFFRRIRPSWDGTAWEVMEWNCEPALEQVKQGIPTMDAMWVGIKEIPYIGSIRVGHQKVPQGFEGDMVSSSKVMTFLERSPYTDAFYENFAPGFWTGNSVLDQHMTWSFMWYRPELDLHDINGADFQDGRYGYSGRLTALPIYENDGRQLLHLALSNTWRDADKPDGAPQGGIAGPTVVRFRARPGLRDAQGDFGTSPLPGNSNRLVDTGNIIATGVDVLGTEFFAVNGPLSVQAEYAWTFVPDATVAGVGQSLNFSGGYIQVSYFLTGENRVYDRRLGSLANTYIASPFTNFWAVRTGDGPLCLGWGAWELAARWNYLDLNDDGIRGGRLQELNVGVNWYLNPNLKMQFEYIHDHRYDLNAGLIPGNVDGLGIRTQFYF